LAKHDSWNLDEDEIYDVLTRWVSNKSPDEEQRCRLAEPILEHLRYPHMSVDKLQSLSRCKDVPSQLIFEALFFKLKRGPGDEADNAGETSQLTRYRPRPGSLLFSWAPTSRVTVSGDHHENARHTSSNGFTGARGDRRMLHGTFSWVIEISETQSSWIFVGVAQADDPNDVAWRSTGHMLYCLDSRFFHQGSGQNHPCGDRKICSGDCVRVVLDCTRHTLAFGINDEKPIVLFRDLEPTFYVPAVDLRDCGDKVRILSNRALRSQSSEVGPVQAPALQPPQLQPQPQPQPQPPQPRQQLQWQPQWALQEVPPPQMRGEPESVVHLERPESWQDLAGPPPSDQADLPDTPAPLAAAIVSNITTMVSAGGSGAALAPGPAMSLNSGGAELELPPHEATHATTGRAAPGRHSLNVDSVSQHVHGFANVSPSFTTSPQLGHQGCNPRTLQPRQSQGPQGSLPPSSAAGMHGINQLHSAQSGASLANNGTRYRHSESHQSNGDFLRADQGSRSNANTSSIGNDSSAVARDMAGSATNPSTFPGQGHFGSSPANQQSNAVLDMQPRSSPS